MTKQNLFSVNEFPSKEVWINDGGDKNKFLFFMCVSRWLEKYDARSFLS